MDDRQRMRASDADRQEVIERLRTALDEGRLWVAGPWGAVLLAASVSVTQARRGGQPR
jgi:NAD-dependent oxidoreductase involved in siderophore biosynthesis